MEIQTLINANIETPRYDNLIITLNKTLDFDEELLDEFQYVVAVGQTIKDLKPGMKVRLNLDNLMKPSYENGETVYRLSLSPIEILDQECAIVGDRAIKSIISE